MSRSRIGIVGSGIAGLAAAREARRVRHDVTVFEARDRAAIGAHAPSFVRGGRAQQLDTLLLWPGYHRELISLVKELGLSLVTAPFDSTAFYVEGETHSYAWYDTVKVGHRGLMVPGARGLRHGATMTSAWVRETFRARRAMESDPTIPVREHFDVADSERFWHHVFPWLCASLGFPHADIVLDASVRAVAAFQAEAVGRSPFLIAEGMPELARRLLEGIQFRSGHSVERVEPRDDGVRVLGSTSGASGPFQEDFDAVVLAMPPAHIGRVVAGTHAERSAWSGFRDDRIVLRAHTDARVMHGPRKDWRTVSYTLPRDRARGVEMTIHWNRVTQVHGGDVFFTWNGPRDFDDEHMLYRTELIRVLPSVAVQPFLRDELPALQGKQRLFFTGVWAAADRAAYLEDGVTHGRSIGARLRSVTRGLG